MLETTLKIIVNFLIFSYKKCFKNYIGYIDIKDGKSLNYIEIELIKIL